MLAELIRHAATEEVHVYPAARKALPDGEQEVEQDIREHAEAERMLDELDGMDPTDARFDQLVSQIAGAIRHHVAEEEADLFPRLRAALPAEEMMELGGKVEQAKKLVPTRPHPAAPDRPPLNKILGAGAGLMDRMRDAMSGRPTTMSDLTDK